VAYTEDGADANKRPVTFLYNGGPGSATIWLEMGSVGPVRVLSDSPEPTHNPPYTVVPNEYSLIDKTDLVFIDAPGTGYSHPVGKGTIKDIAGVDEDLTAFTKFIIRYITVNHRWNSPKFLFGESYGTTRSAGLSATLNEAGVQLNGIVLLSSILNYNARSAGLDNNYITDLPTFAAIAYYHNKIADKPADMLTFVQQAREFAAGPYAQALYGQGNALSAADLDKVATQMSHFTGLSPSSSRTPTCAWAHPSSAKSCCAIRTRFSAATTGASKGRMWKPREAIPATILPTPASPARTSEPSTNTLRKSSSMSARTPTTTP
jgi:carboxypeptidase C (cathepsin A)